MRVFKFVLMALLLLVLPGTINDLFAQKTGHGEMNLSYPDPVKSPGSQLLLDLPGTGTDSSKINYETLPVIPGKHGIVSVGDAEWQFRLHNYLAYYNGRYWCFWSHGPVIEDLARQHLQYSTSLDGLDWSKPKVLAGPPQEGYGYIARGLWIRNHELIALASLYESPSFSGGDLKLVGFRWSNDKKKWGDAKLIQDDSLNNFPPKKLPNGQWMMSRRSTKRDVSIMIGGVKAIDDWKIIKFSPYQMKSGGRPEEPFWWILPDNNLIGIFRDNSRSGRLLRSFSIDNGHSWTPLVQTNFPDATSKFNVVKTSEGIWVMVSNANPAGRNPLCLSTSKNGLVFDRMVRLPVPNKIEEKLPQKDPYYHRFKGKKNSLQYPHVIEQDGSLLVAYSRGKQTVEVIKIKLSDIRKLYQK